MKISKFKLVIFIGFLFSFPISAQPIKLNQLLKKVENAMKDMNSIVYKINYTTKPFDSKDTITRIALCSLYIAPKDHIGVYYIIDEKIPENGYTHNEYDGKYTSFIYYQEKDGKITSQNYLADSVHKNDYIYVDTYTPLTALDLFHQDYTFTRYRSFFKRLLLDEISIKDCTLSGYAVYELTIRPKNKNRSDYIQNMIYKYYIRKTDYLPMAFSFYGEFETMYSMEYLTLDYIDIDPKLSVEDFKVETDLKKINTENYYNNVKEHQL